MRRFDNPARNLAYLVYRWVEPVVDPVRLLRSVPAYITFWRDWTRYASLEGAEPIRVRDTFPRLYERTPTTPFQTHYFYQDVWAFRKIREAEITAHVDVGSRVELIGFLSTICHVTFVDIRPLEAQLENFESTPGTILDLPYEDDSVPSLSCLHVAEHIGLGRYGDPLDPLGSRKACRELARVLSKGGDLYFSLPVGRPRLCFNAHRIHSPHQIVDYFLGLDLVEFSGIDDEGRLRRDIPITEFENADYACGLFHFRKPQ